MNFHEQLAIKHLAVEGHKILAHNYFIRNSSFKGEIDVISFKQGSIFLNEIKKRSEFAENCISQSQIERIWNVWEFFFKPNELHKHLSNIQDFSLEIPVFLQLILVFENKCQILPIQ